jgi:uncharacterized protein (TIGR04141 family)
MKPIPEGGDHELVTLPLNAYLLRPSITPADAWSESSSANMTFYLWSGSRLEPCTEQDLGLLGASVAGDVVLVLLRNPSQPPTWQRFLQSRMGAQVQAVSTPSLGAVLFCAIEEEIDNDLRLRWVAWAFGTGSRALRRKARDPRFGLLVALNLLAVPLLEANVKPDSGNSRYVRPRLREMSFRTTAPYVQQTDQRAARDIPVDGFRVDRSSDLIATVGGSGADPELSTTTLLGGRSLRFRAKIADVDDLITLAETAFRRSRSDEYKELFEWIDNIQLVEDDALSDQLRITLAEQIVTDPHIPSVDTILPDDLLDVGGDRSIQYVAFPGERVTTHGRKNLVLDAVAAMLRRFSHPSLGLDGELRFFDENRQQIGTASVLECLSAEVKISGRSFIAYDGDFYEVNPLFARQIDAELSQIRVSEIAFPAYHGETEPAYNERVRKDCQRDFIVLDRALIQLPGETGIEACDLVAASGALVHVKRKGKSSVLSHLFLQAANSCELLRRSPAARERLAELIAEQGKRPRVVNEVLKVHREAADRRDEIEVVFAFLGNWKGRTITCLPLFSRISLVAEARRVSNLGFLPTVATI